MMIEKSREQALQIEKVKGLSRNEIEAWYIKRLRFINIEQELSQDQLVQNSCLRYIDRKTLYRINAKSALQTLQQFTFSTIKVNNMQEQPKFYAYRKKETQLIQVEEEPLDEISKKIIARAYSGQSLTHISKYPMRPTMMRNSTTSMLV